MPRRTGSDSRRRSRRGGHRLRITIALAAGLTVAAGLLSPGAPADAAPPPTTWLCHPDKQNDPCDIPSDTTDLGTGEVAPAASIPESDKPVDCFYVYPTVSNQVGLNADRSPSPEVASIAKFQASRFKNECRMFSPTYHQTPVVGLAATIPLGIAGVRDSVRIAYADVKAAWHEYLRTANQGRGVIILGHSQGTLLLRRLIREEIDPEPEVRNRIVSAFLMGGNVTTKAGQTTGGDFRNLPVCTRRGQFGCVVAYSTNVLGVPLSGFGNSAIDPLSPAWGLPSGPGFQVACTDPGVLSGDNSPQPVTVPSDPYAFGIIWGLLAYTAAPQGTPTSDSTWTSSRGRGVGACEDRLGTRQYHIRMIVPQQINEIPILDSHLIDYNYGLDRLVDIAGQQSLAWQNR